VNIIKNFRNNIFMKDFIKKHWKITLAGIITGIINGLFGSGGGTVAVPVLTHMLSLKEKNAHATAIMIILPLTIISAFIYFRAGNLDLEISRNVIFGGVIGSVIGALILRRFSDNILRKIFGGFMIIAAVRMLSM